jgi:mRNA interferase YafQ
MLKITRSNRFVKDVELAIRRGFDLKKLTDVIDALANQQKLADKYHDHPLLGNYDDFRECHVEPDWLLIYRIDSSELELFLFRTGTHSDLFK